MQFQAFTVLHASYAVVRRTAILDQMEHRVKRLQIVLDSTLTSCLDSARSFRAQRQVCQPRRDDDRSFVRQQLVPADGRSVAVRSTEKHEGQAVFMSRCFVVVLFA